MKKSLVVYEKENLKNIIKRLLKKIFLSLKNKSVVSIESEQERNNKLENQNNFKGNLKIDIEIKDAKKNKKNIIDEIRENLNILDNLSIDTLRMLKAKIQSENQDYEKQLASYKHSN